MKFKQQQLTLGKVLLENVLELGEVAVVSSRTSTNGFCLLSLHI